MKNLTKQTVYLPVSEFNDSERAICTIGIPDLYGDKVIEQEAFVFTPDQLNEYTANVIRQALEAAAEKAKIIEEELGSNEYREDPIDTFESTEFTADKGYEECSFYRYKPSKQSITNTFDETFKKFEV